MRIKTFEKLFPLKEVYNILINVIKPENLKDFQSYHSKTHILITFLNTKRMLFIIRVTTNENSHRTYLSILILNSKIVNEGKLGKIGDNSSITISSKLFRFLNKQHKKGLDYHLIKIPGIKLKEKNPELKLKRIETRIINEVFRVLSHKFKYFDKLLKFPFSITQIDGSWIFWERIYNPFVSFIEKRIKKLKNNDIKIFRNYDFALNRDNFPRIFDLIAIEKNKIDKPFKRENFPSFKKEREIKLFNHDESEDRLMFNLKMTFLYCNKKYKPMKLIELLKLMNEIKNYSKKLQLRIKICNNIKPQIIIISFFGYEHKILNYLRKHIYHETDYIIPMFILPPIKNTVWHNLKIYNGLSDTEKQTKKNLKKLMKIGNKSYSSSNFKLSKAKNAERQYKELKQIEKIAKDDYKIITSWANILKIHI